tara:strand:+ start:5932 stop:6330 length:399 start_codon:yes stop_codon:yes gene_type:complete
MDFSQLLFWGMFGMIVEVFFTAIRDLVKDNNFNLIGHTSLFMFPVYAFGLSYGFDFIYYILEIDVVRYLSYPLWIWLVEIAIGIPALYAGIKIWDYNYLPERLHWKGIISFAHYPLWVGLGILVEMTKQILF